MSLNSIEEIIEDIRQGKMVVLMDDEDRENEGDLIMAASCVRPEDINFMARYGRGLICLTLTKERCEQLRLPLMVTDTHAKHSTNFTVSIEAARGVTTGISAADRAATILAAVQDDAKPEDLAQPGHIFPLMAQPGGVLNRAGHTEAGCDLARLAGFEATSVIVEILNEDGTMARRADLEKFASDHGLKIGTVADLISYRLQNEKSIERVAECDFPHESGRFKLIAYHDLVFHNLHYALVLGEIKGDEATLVRVQVSNTLSDLLGGRWENSGYTLDSAIRRVAKEGKGVVVMLNGQEGNSDIIRRIKNYHLKDQGVTMPNQGPGTELRTFGFGSQILADLGVSKMRVLSAPKKVHGISGFGLEVVEYVECE